MATTRREAIPGKVFIPKYKALVAAGKSGAEIAAEFGLDKVEDLSAMTTRHRKALKESLLKVLAGQDLSDEDREAKAEKAALQGVPKLTKVSMYDALAASLLDTGSESETDENSPADGEDTSD